jgi:hypothetical protein
MAGGIVSSENTGEQGLEVRGIKTVAFYGDLITAAEGTDAEIYVPVGPLSTFLGLDRSA